MRVAPRERRHAPALGLVVETPRALIRCSRILAVLVGAASLGGQVCWSRLAATVVGGTFASVAITLSGAMMGLAAGSLLAGAIVQPGRARRLLSGTLLICGLTLAAMPWLLPQIARAEGFPVLRRVLAAGLLALAHVPFGAVLPCLTSWRRFSNDRSAAGGGELTALSALGAVIGALGVAELLAPYLGFDEIGCLLGLAAVLSIGLLYVPKSMRETSLEDPGAPQKGPISRTLLVLAFALGLLGLATESLWLRLLGFHWEANTLTYALVTASYVAGLSLGSWVASRFVLLRAPGRRGVALGLGLSAAALASAAALSPWASHAAATSERLALALALVGIPAALFGVTFVLLLGCVGERRNAGRALGFLSGANCAGAAAGPLVLWAASPWVSWPAQALFLIACACAGLMPATGGLRRRGVATALLLTGALGLWGWGFAPSAPAASDYFPLLDASPASDFNAPVFPFVRTDLESTVAVSRDTRSGVEMLWIDRGHQGDTSPLGRRIPAFLGRFPAALLGRTPSRALVIGLGTGITLSGVVEGGSPSVEVAELSRGVIEANRTILAEANGHVLERREVQVLHADGRATLVDAVAPYDLIVADMIHPGVVGAGELFSREFYALARRRLTPDGLFVHWIPCFQLSPPDLSAVIAAFLESFPEGTAWIGYLGPRRLILGLAGGALPDSLPETVASRLALGPSELKELAGDVSPIRDADPRLEYRSRPRGDGSWGRENLLRVLDRMAGGEESRRAWRLFAEAGLAEEAPRALALFREASRMAPPSGDAEFLLEDLAHERHLESAQEAAERRDGDAMLGALKRAASYPLHGVGNLYLADALAARGRVEEAISEFEKAIVKSPKSADAHLKLALLAYRSGDSRKARKAFEVALTLRPDRPPLYREFAGWIEGP